MVYINQLFWGEQPDSLDDVHSSVNDHTDPFKDISPKRASYNPMYQNAGCSSLKGPEIWFAFALWTELNLLSLNSHLCQILALIWDNHAVQLWPISSWSSLSLENKLFGVQNDHKMITN